MKAGIVLLGTEVKSIREGRVNLRDSFGRVEAGGGLSLQRAHQLVQPSGICGS